MSSAMMTDKGARGSEAVLRELQDALVELIDLSLTSKQAHWNVTGPLFKPVHEQLDEVYDTARLGTDEIAERIATLGGTPDGRASTVAASAPLAALPAGQISAHDAVSQVCGRLDEMSLRLGARIERLASDPVSQGILIDIAGTLDKQGWMLRVQTR
jgi:starvation-inducible DNA-binding protein